MTPKLASRRPAILQPMLPPRNRLLDRVRQQGGQGVSQQALQKIKSRKYSEQAIVICLEGHFEPGQQGQRAKEIYEVLNGECDENNPLTGPRARTFMDNHYQVMVNHYGHEPSDTEIRNYIVQNNIVL